jgi:hypothetical protein
MYKHIMLSAVVILVCTYLSSAQPVKGDININAGIGAVFYYSSGSTISIPPIGASLDYNTEDRFSLGG